MKTLLLAEDDVDFGNILKQYLEIHKYEVTWVRDGLSALEIFKRKAFTIGIFDVMMPELDGFTLAEKIIDINPDFPFLFLTARKMKEDKIKGLKLGADDYIVKPFEVDELMLRIKNIIKRSERHNGDLNNLEYPEKIQIGAYSFHTQKMELRHLNKPRRVTEKEAELILFFYAHQNQLIKRSKILNAVWGKDDFFSGRSMDVFISRLRKYFQADPAISIESIRGIGLEFRIKDGSSIQGSRQG